MEESSTNKSDQTSAGSDGKSNSLIRPVLIEIIVVLAVAFLLYRFLPSGVFKSFRSYNGRLTILFLAMPLYAVRLAFLFFLGSSMANRPAWLLRGLVLSVTSSFLAFTQYPYPDAYHIKTFFESLIYPIERNADLRLLKTSPDLDLIDIDGLRGTGKVWAVGDGGVIYATTDGGKNWLHQESGTDKQLTNVHVLQHGRYAGKAVWITANDGTLLRTRDGGKRWETPAVAFENIPAGTESFRFGRLSFVSEEKGWATTEGGRFLLTKDGGNTWAVLNSDYPVLAVYFRDPQVGWMVKRTPIGAAIWRSTNGGTNWKENKAVDLVRGVRGPLPAAVRAAVARDEADLKASIFFLNGTEGWIRIGTSFLVTKNGGQEWDAKTLDIWPDVECKIQAFDTRNILTTTSLMYDVYSSDGGDAWSPFWSVQGLDGEYPIPFIAGNSHYFADKRCGWLVGPAGAIIHTSNAGTGWTAQSGYTHITQASFPYETEGWATGWWGPLLHTTTHGRQWHSQWSKKGQRVAGVFFRNGNTGWMTTSPVGAWPLVEGREFGLLRATQLWSTKNGGQTWDILLNPTDVLQGRLVYVDESHVWSLSDGRLSQCEYADGVAKPTSIRFGVLSACFVNAGTGCAIVRDGERVTLKHTTDAGQTWVDLSLPQFPLSGIPAPVIDFVDDSNGWILWNGGDVFRTRNGGTEWEKIADAPKEQINDLDFVNEKVGYAVGDNGTVLKTTDGGISWSSACGPYRKWPTPWYYLSLCFVGVSFVMASRRPQPVRINLSSRNVVVSDRPLQNASEDALGFADLAKSISSFIRNENTEPTFVFAITGKWGSGKTSLMNLIKEDLSNAGFPHVWFNPWHHQTEQSLLASLLAAIRDNAVPPVTTWFGMLVRLKILIKRLRTNKYTLLSLAALLAILFGAMESQPLDRLDNLFKGGEKEESGGISVGILGRLVGIEKPENLQEWTLKGILTDTGEAVPLVAVLASMLFALSLLWRNLRAFGFNPAHVVTLLKPNIGQGLSKEQVSARSIFAKEFGEATEALLPRAPVILLDDLDRCEPETVMEILQAVNFIVSSGKCYVLLGLDDDLIEHCIQETFEKRCPKLAAEDKDYGRHYLEKLFNVRIPVPDRSAVGLLDRVIKPEGNE